MQGRTTGSSSTGGWLVEEGAGAWAESDRSNITSGQERSVTAGRFRESELQALRPGQKRSDSSRTSRKVSTEICIMCT